MTFAERIKDHFSDNIQTAILIADSMSEQIAHAGELLSDCILKGGKILVCGHGGNANLAQYFSTQLLDCFEMERPALPAIDLTNTSVITSIASHGNYQQVFSKQINALGRENDILVVICDTEVEENLVEAVTTAHEKNISVISLCGTEKNKLTTLCKDQDISLCVPSDRVPRIRESHMLILHCLSDVIDKCLFGV